MRPVPPALWLSTRGLWFALALALVCACASVVPWLSTVALALAAVALALLAADVALGPTTATLAVRRLPVGALALRRPARIAYEIENRCALAIRIGILETPVAQVDVAVDVVVAHVPARARGAASVAVCARERGIARFDALYVWAENRLGLVRRRFRIDAAQSVRVLPDLSAVESYGILAQRKTLVDAGLRRMRRRGTGSDFESLREYAAGDAFGAIDWKATARRGRTMVVQYEVERSQNVVVALDCGRLMMPRIGAQRKFDYALTAALSVARVAQAADDNVGLLAFAATPVLRIAPRRGRTHYGALARAAFDLQPRFEEPDYETAFAGVRSAAHKRSLVVLFTDIFDPVTSAAVLAGLGSLVPRHLAMCVLMNDGAVHDALAATLATPGDAYRTGVAMALADERARAIATLRARGIIVVDVPAAALTLALLDAYLDVKARGLL